MIGIIGGTGLEKNNIIKDPEKVKITTKYGEPSSEILMGKIMSKDVALISRHGVSHSITPTNVNNRANIWALKELGCEKIIATTACGSLREQIKPGDFVIADQFIDFTRHRIITFYDNFENGNIRHCPMGEPFDKEIRSCIEKSAEKLGIKLHTKSTIVTIEGPRFSTKAESHMFRSWGADLVNMSTAPEAILANEAGLKYAAIAISTDYDCWKDDEEAVSMEMVFENFKKSVDKLIELLVEVISIA
ncbi:MAG: S-methyl-5'-thioadenosine phosphorylase [Bacteroidales bacterium]|jgi:5'-methylthioadenosine phosphorylase|nr:S-methyl-5'-thioadenosine phosphorylase [Bacteroidales bacterium]